MLLAGLGNSTHLGRNLVVLLVFVRLEGTLLIPISIKGYMKCGLLGAPAGKGWVEMQRVSSIGMGQNHV
jgi:hypothetical protein